MADNWNMNDEQDYREAAVTPEEVPVELGRAGSLHVLGKVREALEELEALLARLPECSEGYRVRAMILMELGQEVEALADWERYHSLTAGDAGSRISLAHCQQKAGRWSEAAEEYRAVLVQEPDRDDALLGLGLCQLRERRAEEALELLTLYLERHPAETSARFGRAVAYQLLGETDEAVKHYEGLLAEGLQEVECLTNLATIYREKKDAERMADCASRLLQLSPESPVGLECAAQAAYLQGDFEKALDQSEQLVLLDGADPGRWMNVALCRKKLGRLADAQQAYAEALALQPSSAEARLRCAEVLIDLGRDEEALELCREGIEQNFEVEEFYQLAAQIHARAGRTEEVEALLEVLARTGSQPAEAWFRLGNLRLDRKAHEDAQAAYRACLETRGDWPEARLNLALSYFESGHADEAEAELTTVLQQKPDWEPALRAAAVTALKLGHFEDALARHEKLIAAGVREAEVFYNTALLNDQMGQPERAEVLYRLALEDRPGFTEALVGLGHALEHAGRQDEAKHCWAQAMEQRPQLAQEYFRSKR